ncbi:MAG: hypothetical protein U0V49_06675 [Saprospiraceae bacterium]
MKIIQKIHVSLMLSLSMMASNSYCQVNDTLGTGPNNNSGSIACVNELKIIEFSGSKTFKVVVSQTKSFPIDVFGLDFFPSPPYKWELGDFPLGSIKWELRPVNLLQGKTEIKIDAVNNTLMPKSNDYFGDKYGVVKLSDHNGNSTLSTDPYLNKKVQVFFEKDAPNPSNPNEPNWSYYWKQFVDKNRIESLQFVQDITNYCSSSFPGTKVTTNSGCTNRLSRRTTYGQAISQTFSIEPKNKGIHNFIAVLAHENHHIVLWEEFWPPPNGYTGNLDLDKDGKLDDEDGDGYPNWFEKSQTGKDYDFRLNHKGDIFGATEIDNEGYEVFSSGTIYEEFECNKKLRSADVTSKDHLDWSFDPTGKFQGKNWK